MKTKDNGVYVEGLMDGNAVTLLLDSGATTTLISKDTLETIRKKTDDLREHTGTVCTVDGTPLNVQGSVQLKLKVARFTTAIDATVCDKPNIQEILGQDFMANHIKSWEIQNQRLHTLDGNTIDIVTDGTGLSVCRVLVKEMVEITPMSFQMLPVEGKMLCARGSVC
ncbi:hypothetical protein DPMN_042061 [Dreissena polymorpha]|uniref:Peptidase A2 domain-containing protein n=1 Tax=Dreissena polymorpha TaxID=45954 RepID=A0A9D4CXW3_DREPO|nr:hypothetical protein DPMN_042061 [Dreissena polymorpha]